MPRQLVLTVIAKDRPGLVDTIADLVADAGANWVESSMSRLEGQFAGIVGISVPDEALEALQTAFADLEAQGITVIVRRSDGEEEISGPRVHVELVSQDHPGILRAVTGVLADRGVSIDDLETEVAAGSMSGEALFKASADLVLPADLTPAALRDALQSIAADIMADIEIAE